MRFKTAAILLSFFLPGAFAGAGNALAEEPAAPPSALIEDVDGYVQRFMSKRHVPGVSIAVAQDGRLVLAKGYGLANVELGVEATADTVYQLASVTKTFTATAIMMLARDGKLSLDDKITERLPDLPEAWRDVTVRQLLNHTSGIKSYTFVKDFHTMMRKDFAQREILDLVAKDPLEFQPGEKMSYSNTGYFLLGMLIEKVAGKSYGEFMDERIFRPLGMAHTRANDLRAIIPNRADGYSWDGKELRNGEYVSPTQPFAAGMLVSTVGDLAKWDAAIARRTLLDESTYEEMWSPTRLNDGSESGYGLGWGTSKVNGRRRVSHGGGIPGFSTEFERYPDDGLAVIVLTNAEGGHAEALARGVAGRFVPELAENQPEPIADQDPPTTERLKRMFEGALRGEIDEDLFTAEAKKQLAPRIRDDKERLASFGALKSFQLLERNEEEGGARLRYRVVLENETVNLHFSLDKDGKIQGAGIQLADPE